MARGESDHSIHREFLRGDNNADPIAQEPALGQRSAPESEEDRVRASVWDEPASRVAGLTPGPDDATYAAWYRRKLRETSVVTALGVTLILALASGPFAILGTMLTMSTGGTAGIGILMIVLVGPMIEEMLKVGATLIALERKPYLFLSAWQILIAGMAGGLCFAVVENLLYIHVYIEDPSDAIIFWRWTVCTFMHVGCSTIASLGLIRMYRRARANATPPEVRLAYPPLIAAIALHGVYNAGAVLLEFVLTPF